MQLVIPMAGLGQRYADAGYTIPKPLIEVAGVPMVVGAVEEFPAASRVVFIVHPQHVEDNQIDRRLSKLVPGCRVVVAPGLTEGQACSVRLAVDELELDDDVLVGACDNSHLYSGHRWQSATRLGHDVLIWTYRHDPRVLVNPQQYGWVKSDESGQVSQVSVKTPLSDSPINDHVVSGAFWFRSAGLMRDGIDKLVESGQRVNNEFYLDAVPNVLISEGHKVGVFEVEKYIGWGTPDDYEDFNRWQLYFDGLRQQRAA